MKRLAFVAGMIALLAVRGVAGPSPASVPAAAVSPAGTRPTVPLRLIATLAVAAPMAVQAAQTADTVVPGMPYENALASVVRSVSIEVLRHTERLLYPPTIILNRPAPAPPEHQEVQLYIDAAASGLDKRIRDAMRWIDGTNRRLLALKYYLAKGGAIRSQWTWTPREIVRFKKSADYGEALAEVEKVKAKFAELNPGYTLQVKTEVRTVEEQITIWNATPSITASGNKLLEECLELVNDSTFDAVPEKERIKQFRALLSSSKVPYVPTAAVPGFSQHGQLRAFDFIIRQGELIVAGSDAATIRAVWDNSGWTAKLKTAIEQASDKLSGPLASPREPWHYTYEH